MLDFLPIVILTWSRAEKEGSPAFYVLSRSEARSNPAYVSCAEDNSGNKYTFGTIGVLNHTVDNVNISYMIECKDIGDSLAGEIHPVRADRIHGG